MQFVSNKAFPMLAQSDNLFSYKFQRGFCPSENTAKGSLLYVFLKPMQSKSSLKLQEPYTLSKNICFYFSAVFFLDGK